MPPASASASCASCPQLYFARWFLSPILSSFRDPSPQSYSYQLRIPAAARVQNEACEVAFPQALLFDDETWNAPGNRVSLSAIVPSYNEEDRVQLMLDDAWSYLAPRAAADPSFTFEILFVDDGSRDRTAEVIQSFVSTHEGGADRIRLLKLRENQGKGGAVQQGMLHARGELLLMVDADGATRFSDVAKLESALQALVAQPGSNGHGLAVGSRKHLQSDAVATRKWYRNVLMYGFHFLVSSLTGIAHIKDTQCGFKLFTRATAQYLFTNQHLRRWCFDVELLFLSVQSAFGSRTEGGRRSDAQRIGVVEVAVNWTEIPGSKINLLESSILMGRDLVLIRGAYMLGVWKWKPLGAIKESMTHSRAADVNAAVARDVKRKVSSKK